MNGCVDVIGVVVAAELVVRDHDVGLVLLEQARQAFGGIVYADVAEHVGPVLVLPVDHARVVVPEQLEICDAERFARSLELGEADAGDLRLVVARFSGLIPPGASPSSPFVHVTTMVRTPSSAYPGQDAPCSTTRHQGARARPSGSAACSCGKPVTTPGRVGNLGAYSGGQ